MLRSHMATVVSSIGAEEVAYWDFLYPRQDEHDSDPDAEAYVEAVRDRGTGQRQPRR